MPAHRRRQPARGPAGRFGGCADAVIQPSRTWTWAGKLQAVMPCG